MARRGRASATRRLRRHATPGGDRWPPPAEPGRNAAALRPWLPDPRGDSRPSTSSCASSRLARPRSTRSTRAASTTTRSDRRYGQASAGEAQRVPEHHLAALARVEVAGETSQHGLDLTPLRVVHSGTSLHPGSYRPGVRPRPAAGRTAGARPRRAEAARPGHVPRRSSLGSCSSSRSAWSSPGSTARKAAAPPRAAVRLP